ncbi:Uncharacterized protein SCF082_LOCUS49288, partial [Durusdinium trenchii]
DWSNSTAVCKAFQIGKWEGAAVSCLQANVEPAIVSMLRDCVSTRGMRSFISHEVVGRGCFNTGWTSASGNQVKLFIQRYCHDWDALTDGMKRQCTYKEAVSLHQVTGLFLHFLQTLETYLPSGQYPAAREKLTGMFLLGGLDAELQLQGETTVPPGDVRAIGAFRNLISSHESQQASVQEERARERELKVRQATLEQIKGQLEDDIKRLRDTLPSKQAQTVETALDMKYLKDRQAKGFEFVAEWMRKNCRVVFISVKDDGEGSSMSNTLSEFSKYIAERGNTTGTTHVICSIDATLWPASNQYMLDSVSLMQNVCALGPQNVGLVQNPVFHAGTTMQALVKHSRRLEDALMKSELDITQRVTLLFQKEAARQGSDKRPLTQVAVSPVASKACKWSDCEVHQTGLVGPLPLVRVSDMEGYDPENGLRPGAGAR